MKQNSFQSKEETKDQYHGISNENLKIIKFTNIIKLNKLRKSFKKINIEPQHDENIIKKELEVLNEDNIFYNNDNFQININPGAISFSFPCETIYERKFENEIMRLKIENLNKNFLNLYERPSLEITKYIMELENRN